MPDDIDLSPDRCRALFDLDDGPRWPDSAATSTRFEAWSPYVNAVIAGPGRRSLEIALAAVDAAPDDDALVWLGAMIIEPLLDLHSIEIFDRFEELAITRPALRTALSGAWLEVRVGKRRGQRGRHYEERARRLLESFAETDGRS